MPPPSTPAIASWAWSGPTSSLSYLDGFLRSVDLPVGRVLLVNDQGQVLASSNADRGTGPATMVRDALPEELGQVPLADLVGGPAGFREIAGYSVLAERLAEAPFSLLYVVSEALT